ncbi:MAG: 4Fe-4S binding protein [Proteobacteria bacterium]|nr:4Fe-4S binding protein [Pseudomonadota bacterium]
MRSHIALRVFFFFVGIFLFYAPSAVLVRVLLHATDSHLQPDAHRICLRMPFEWLLQPWMYSTMVREPLYLIGLVLLPSLAFLFGPVFCGWLCPAGSVTELLGRLLPDRFKLNLGGKLNPAPIRYGVLVGMMLSPFLGGYVCCTFCNFTMMQNLVSALTGNPTGLMTWASFTILTFALWFFFLGIFLKGGRGWCNLICPAGAVQGLAHVIGSRYNFSRAIRVDIKQCVDCDNCVRECPAWAFSSGGCVNLHACNICRDCLHVCENGAISYGRLNSRSR